MAGVLTSLFVALSLPIGPTRLTPEPVVRAALLAFLGLPGWTVGMLAGRYIAVIGPAGLRRRTATADNGDGLEPGPWFLTWRRIATLVYTAVAGLDAVITAIATSAIVTQINVASTERPLVVAYAAFLAAFPVLLAVALVIEARLRRSMSRLPDDILARHQDLPQQVRERFMAHAKPQSSTYALSISFFILLSQTMIMMQVIGAQRVFYPLFNVLLGCSMAYLLLNVASWIPLWISTLSRTGPNRIGMGATGAG